jgi:TrmH family RNA methyltransferase
MLISSLQNPKVKETIRLRERKERDRTQRFLIEGYRELARAVEGGISVPLLFVCAHYFLGENEESLIAALRESGAEVYDCTPEVFAKLSYRDRPDGLLAVGEQRHLTLAQLDLRTPALLLVAESIEKPGNLGTLLRSADAVGADGMIVCDRCTDVYNPNTVRASVGTLFTIPVVETSSSEAHAFLQREQIQVVATLPSADLVYTDADLSGSVAIIVGTEQLGLTPFWQEAAQLKVRIPMRGVADSLNVAIAGALLLYEALRQR